MQALSPFICFSIYFEVASLEPAMLFCAKTPSWHFSACCVCFLSRMEVGLNAAKVKSMAPQVTFGAQLNEFLGLLTLTTEGYSFYLLSSWLFTLHISGQVTSLCLSSICPRGAQTLIVLLQKITPPNPF